MYLKEKSIYLSGLFDMASSFSRSSFDVSCFSSNNYLEEFKKLFNINEDINIIKCNDNLDEVLKILVDDIDKVIEGIKYNLKREIGIITNIYTVDNKGLSILDKYNFFYNLEDIYFLETNKLVLVIIMGNNE